MVLSRRVPLGVSVFLGLGLLSRNISPVRDAVTEQFAAGYHLHFSWSYLVWAPFCSLADLLTALSLRELLLFLGFVFAAILVWPCRWGTKALWFMGVLGFLAWGVLVPRPMARLMSDDPDIVLIDFHSHTSFSHDGRHSFTPEANMHWHERQGFGAAFITDHNLSAGAERGKILSQTLWPHPLYSSLPGEEISLFKTHLGVLGNTLPVNRDPYDSDAAKIPAFIELMHQSSFTVVAHLPEYWREHWKVGNTDFLSWDVDGFEIVNSVPYCLDFPIALRRQIIEHCRLKNLFVTGVSDNHGWGSATAVWSAMRIPGWQTLPPEALEKAVLAALARDKFQAVRVLERMKYFPENDWQFALSPLGNLWILSKTLGSRRALSCWVWIWVIYGMNSLLNRSPVRRRRERWIS